MKDQNSLQDVRGIKERVEKMASFQMGAFSIPLGIIWLLLDGNILLNVLERQFSLDYEKPYNLAISLAHVVFLFLGMVGGILIGYFQYQFYNRKFGTWFPAVLGTKRDRLIFAIALPILLFAFFMQERSGTTFPWMALTFGILYTISGLMEKPPRWYYPVIALTMMTVSFLPFLMGADSETVQAVSYAAFGSSLIFIGWLDHRNLMRVSHALQEEKVTA
jgi:hypothetical protein